MRHLEDLLGGPLSKGRLKGVLEEEASTLLDKLLRGECNGGDPCTKDSLISKAKKLRVRKEEEKEEKEKEEKEKEEKEEKDVRDLEKKRDLLKKMVMDATLEIPNLSLFDQFGYDKVANLVDAGEVRDMEAEDQLPPKIKLRESWTNLPIRERVNPRTGRTQGLLSSNALPPWLLSQGRRVNFGSPGTCLMTFLMRSWWGSRPL